MKPSSIYLAMAVLWFGASYLSEGIAAEVQMSSGSAVRLVQFEPRVEDGPGDLQGQNVGRISVLRASDRRTVYADDTPLQPACAPVPAVTLLNQRLVAVCGNLGGRHNTYKVLRMEGEAIDVATLDMQDGNDPLRVDQHGRIFGVVMRRDLYPKLTGPRYFPIVYRLHEDDAGFGFRPDFSSSAAPIYAQRYASMKQSEIGQPAAEEMLAMLLATQDRSFVCKELAYLEIQLVKRGQFQQRQDARIFLKEWAQKLPEAGYPAFNDLTCKGKK